MSSNTALSEEEQWRMCVGHFYQAAIIQGRIAYCLMSIHAVNPNILNSILNFNLYPFLWVNMLYGIAVMIYSRPSLSTIAPLNRLSFGILGSLMFNHASMICYNWLVLNFFRSPYLLTFLGFLSGRLMMIHLLAFLYHVDTRTNIPGVTVNRDYAFEGMYFRM